MIGIQGSGMRDEVSRFRGWSLGYQVLGLEFRVLGFGFRVANQGRATPSSNCLGSSS